VRAFFFPVTLFIGDFDLEETKPNHEPGYHG
jgi:hypothetical protein